MPMHLPEPPKPASPWTPPPGEAATGAGPGHCSAWDGAPQEQACAGPSVANLKQKHNIRLLAHLTGSDEPDVERMSAARADREWGALFSKWMDQQRAKAANEAP